MKMTPIFSVLIFSISSWAQPNGVLPSRANLAASAAQKAVNVLETEPALAQYATQNFLKVNSSVGYNSTSYEVQIVLENDNLLFFCVADYKEVQECSLAGQEGEIP